MNAKNRTVRAVFSTDPYIHLSLGKVTGSERAELFKNKIALFVYHKTSGIIQPVFKIAPPAGEQTVPLQKIKGYFNPAMVISVAASLPINVHTSRSISNTFLT